MERWRAWSSEVLVHRQPWPFASRSASDDRKSLLRRKMTWVRIPESGLLGIGQRMPFVRTKMLLDV
jgi:hypothetical protein